jgi:type VI secretion system secreted protein Hcp
MRRQNITKFVRVIRPLSIVFVTFALTLLLACAITTPAEIQPDKSDTATETAPSVAEDASSIPDADTAQGGTESEAKAPESQAESQAESAEGREAPPTADQLPGADLFAIQEEVDTDETLLYSPGPAADMFLHIEGLSGESKDSAHEEWIDVLSYSWGVSQPGAASLSSGISRSAARSDHSEFSIVKLIDKTSPKLALYTCKGQHIEEVTLELVYAEGDRNTYMVYTLENVIVASVQTSGQSGGDPSEEVSFTYGSIKWTYTEFDGTGKAKGDVEAQWNLETDSGG